MWRLFPTSIAMWACGRLWTELRLSENACLRFKSKDSPFDSLFADHTSAVVSITRRAPAGLNRSAFAHEHNYLLFFFWVICFHSWINMAASTWIPCPVFFFLLSVHPPWKSYTDSTSRGEASASTRRCVGMIANWPSQNHELVRPTGISRWPDQTQI